MGQRLKQLSQKSSPVPQLLLGVCTVLFIGAYLLFERDLVFATKILVGSSAVALVIMLAFFRKQVKRNDWLILVATLGFGSLTIAFQDEVFIQWRTTIVNILIAMGLVGMFYFKKSPVKMIFSKALEIELPEKEWLRTNLWWALYMLIMAALNAGIILLGFSSEVWMTFKMVINPAITFILAILLMVYLVRKSKALQAKKALEQSLETSNRESE